MADREPTALGDQRVHMLRSKHELATEAGGLLNVAEVVAMLGNITEGEVYVAVQERRMLGVEEDGLLRFPACQFESGMVYAGIQAILHAAPTTNGWRILQYLFGQDEALACDRSIDLVRGSEVDIQRAVRFAKSLEE